MSQAVATVAFLQGQAWAKSPDGSLRPLTVGSVLNTDEILVTAEGARVELDTGDAQLLAVQGGQEVAMNRDLNNETATSVDEALLSDASVQEALTILEQGGDLTTDLEETAAGNTGGGGSEGHGFVQLARVVETLDSQAFNYEQASTDGAAIQFSDSELPRNNPPEVVDQQLVFDEDTVLTGQIIATDVENDTLSYAVLTAPLNGVLALDPVNGSFTFTPNENYNGADSFVVTVTDSAGNSVNTTISLTINAVNDAPVSSAQPVVTNEDTPVTGQVVATDVENNPLSFAVSTNPANGAVTINAATGEYQYTPNPNFNGADSFVVTVSDGQGGTTTSIVNVTINAVNDAPIATNQNLTVEEDVQLNGQIVASDVDNDPLSYTLSTAPANGSVMLNPNGSFTYTPNTNYNGSDSFVVTVSDGFGGVTTSTINIAVTPVNDAPVAANRTLSIAEDTQDAPLNIAAPTDVDGDSLTITVAGLPSVGSVTLADGTPVTNGQVLTIQQLTSLRFDAPANVNSIETGLFQYSVSDGQETVMGTITINVTPANDAPVTANQTITTDEDVAYNGQIVASDIDGDTLSYSINTTPTNGTLSLNPATGQYVYTPNANYNGNDSFSVLVSDGRGGIVTSVVTVGVTPVNDAPVANNDLASTPINTAVVIDVRANDTDVDNLQTDLVVSNPQVDPAQGTVALDAQNRVVFTPALNFSGIASITYTITDPAGLSSTATANVNVGINTAPTGADKTVSLNEDGAYTFTANDFGFADADAAQTLNAVRIDSLPAAGSLTLGGVAVTAGQIIPVASIGSLVFTPAPDANGINYANFTFSVQDSVGAFDATPNSIQVNVTAVNDAPVAQSTNLTVAEDAAVITGNFIATDIDAGAVLTYAINVAAPAGFTFNANGSYSFDASNAAYQSLGVGQSVTLTIPYTVTDEQNASSTANLVITVTGTNDAPVAQASSFSVAEGAGVVNGNVNATDIDANASLTYALNNPAPAGLIFNANGSYSFDPTNAAYNSLGVGQSVVLTIPYAVTDDQGATSIANLVITVTGTNDAPIAQPAAFTIAEDTAIFTGAVNATDADANASLTYALNNPAPAGLVFNSDGSYTFDASNAAYQSLGVGQSVILTIPYTVTDDQSATSTANLVITVTGTNDGPVATDDVASTAINTAVTIDVLANDSDIDNAQTDLVVSNPQVDAAQGTATLDAQGRVVFTPALNFSGVATITYTLTDPSSASTTGSVTVNVGNNTAPTGADNVITLNEDGSHAFTASEFGFADADAAQTFNAVRIDSLPAAGSLTLGGVAVTAGQIIPAASLGTLVFTPAANANGNNYANFTFSVQDSAGAFDLIPNSIQLDVIAVNDAPVNQLPAAQITDEDSALVFSAGNGNQIQISDLDAGSAGNIEVTLSVTNGTLTLASITGLSFVVGDGTADSNLVFSGSLADINNALATLTFNPSANYNGPAVLSITTSDMGNTGSGGVLTDTDTINITVNPANDAPTIFAQLPDQNATEDAAFNFQFASNSFADVDADVLTYTAQLAGGGTLPSWLVFDSATRTFSGTPANGDVGTVSIDVIANDGNGGTVTDTFNLVVANVNDAPTLDNAIANQNATEDSAFNFTFPLNSFSDVDVDDVISYSAQLVGGGALPAWLSFDANTRTFSGTPANGDVGTISVEVIATDIAGATATDNFDIVIANTNDDPTVFNVIPNQNATEDAAFNFQFSASTFTDIDAGDVLTYTAQLAGGGALPTWLSFDSATRTFSGIPLNADVGTISVSVTANDGNGGVVTDTFDIQVANTNDAPTLDNSIADQGATENTAFNFTFPINSFSDVDVGDVISYSAQLVGGGALPAWLSFDSATRTFSGTPANGDVGTISVQIIATDIAGATATDNFDIVIANTNDDPTVLNVIPNQNAIEDAAFNFQFSASTFADIDAGATLTYTAELAGGGALPSWLSFDSATRTFSGLPLNADVGTISVSVTANDGNGGTVTDTFDIQVANTNDAPTLDNSILDQNATEDSAFNFTFPINSFSDVDLGDVISYSAQLVGGGALPAWLSFDSATRTFSGTPINGDVGTISVEVIATDIAGATAADNFDIVIGGVNDAPVNIVPAAITMNEDTTQAITGLSISDVDSASANLTVTLQITNGVLNVTGGSAIIAGNGTNAVTLTGTQAEINSTLAATVNYVPTTNFNGTSTLTITTNDNGNSGVGGALTDVDTVTIRVNPVDDATQITPVSQNLTETNAILSVNGTINAVDVDSPAGFIAQNNVAGSGGFGLFTLAANGQWSYSTNNAQNQFAAGTTYTDTLTVTALDGTTSTITVNILGTNDAPVITGLVTSLNYAESNAATITRTIIDSAVVLTDVDSANFAGGNVTVTINNVVAAQDQLTVQNQGTGVNQLSVSGTNVSYNFGAGAVLIGTISGGTLGAPLVISLNNNATPVAVDALVQRIAYGNSSQLPNTTPRNITFSVTDGDGTANGGADTFTQNITINVASNNDAPVLGALGGARTYTEGGAAVVLDTNATIADGELAALANFGGMTMTVGRRGGINTDDDFVGTGTLSLTGGNVVLNGVTVGSYNAAQLDAGQLLITFANGVTNAQATSVLRQIAYRNTSDAPPSSLIVDFVLNDGNTGAQGSGGARNSTTVGVTVNVTGVNDAPVAQALTLNGTEETNLPISLTGSDVDGTIQSIQLVSLPSAAQGVLYLSDGVTAVTTAMNLTPAQASNLIFTPTNNFNGNLSFNFIVRDNLGLASAPAAVNISVAAVNDAPVNTVPAAITMNEDTTQAITGLSIADIDSASANLTVTLQITNGVLNVTGGSAIIAGSGTNTVVLTGTQAEINSTLAATVNYVPTHNFSGTSTLTITTNDNGNSGVGGALTDVDTIAITVLPVNDAPETAAVTVSGNEDTTITITLSGSDIDGSVASYAIKTLPANGTLFSDAALTNAINVNDVVAGPVYFSPTANWNGSTGFDYASVDNLNLEDATPASVSITVNAVNDAPTTTTANLIVNEESVNTALGIVAPTDVDSASLTITVTGLPSVGSVTLADGTPVANGQTLTIAQLTSLQYDAPADLLAATNTSFTYSVSDGVAPAVTGTANITVNPINDAPVANALNLNGTEDNNVAVNLSGSDVDGLIQSVQLTSLPTAAQGVLYLADGVTAVTTAMNLTPTQASNLIFTPTNNFNGNLSFNFTVTDNQGLASAPATVSIAIAAVNDAPVNTVPSAITMNEDTTQTITGLSISDVDSASGSLTVTLQITNGILNISGGSAVIAGNGTNTVTLTGTQAEVNSTLAATVNYVPTANFNGTSTLTMTTSDNGNSGSGGALTDVDTLTINVDQVWDLSSPNYLVSGNEDTVINDSVGYWDSTTSGGVLTYQLLTNPAHGTLVFNIDGTYTYTPDANFNGNDSFTYKVIDAASGESGDRTVGITINPVWDLSAPNYSESVNEGTVLTNNLYKFASTTSGGSLTYQVESSPNNGTLLFNSDGTYNYTPNSNFTGMDSFVVRIFDPAANESFTRSVSVTVNPVNDAPVANALNLNGTEDNNVFVNLSGSDVDGTVQSIQLISLPTAAQGVLYLADGVTAVTTAMNLTVAQASNLIFTPTNNFNGNLSFNFTVTDNQGLAAAPAAVNIAIAAVNDAPDTAAVNASGNEDTTITIALSGSDIDGSVASYVIKTLPANGALYSDAAMTNLVIANGVVTGLVYFRPANNWNGSTSFNYAAVDNLGLEDSTPATATITVNAINDVPVTTTANLIVNEETQNTPLGIIAPTDVDSASLTITVTGLPSVGSVTLANGTAVTVGQTLTIAQLTSLQYDAPVDLLTTTNTSFTYSVSDGVALAVTGVANITVNPVNDAPIANDDPEPSLATTPVGLLSEYYGYREGPDGGNLVNIPQVLAFINGRTPDATFTATEFRYGLDDLFFNDLGNGTNLQSFLGADAASLSVDPGTTSDAVIRMRGYVELDAGTYNFRVRGDDGYQIKIDGKVVAEVNAIQSPTGTVHTTFTVAESGFHQIEVLYWDQGGQAVFQAEISNNNGSTYQFLSQLPTVSSGVFNLLEDNILTIAPSLLLANDTDIDGDTLGVLSVGNATQGTVSMNASGNIIFTPRANYSGPASFEYTVSDGKGGTDVAKVAIFVSPVNDAPVTNSDAFVTGRNTSLSLSTSTLLGNDIDVDGDILSVTGVSGALNGAVSLSGSTVTFNPNNNFSGVAGFSYTVSDGNGGTSTASVEVIVGSQNRTGTAGDNLINGNNNSEFILGLGGNDTLNGSGGDDLLVGGAGNDTLTGGAGADVFVWQLADKGAVGSPANDTIADFTQNANDRLDISDLLQGENSSNLTNYLHFTYDSGSNATTVHISSAGGYSLGFSNSQTDQTIVLSNYNPGSTSDATIINNLIAAGKLITD